MTRYWDYNKRAPIQHRYIDCANTLVIHFELRTVGKELQLFWRKPTVWCVKRGQRAGTVDRQGRRVVSFRKVKYLEKNLIDGIVYA